MSALLVYGAPSNTVQMDLQQLSQLFASTFSPDPNVQKMAELQIRKVRRDDLTQS